MRHRFLALALFVAASVAAAPQTPFFTYQGRLTHAGAPVDGTRTLRFTLYDMPSGGAQIGDGVEIPDVAIESGVFTVDLLFPDAFTGEQRWLEVWVDGVPMLPRQPVNAAPVALYALDGNAGPQGPVGTQGPAGEPGADGDAGPAGPQGDPGVTGATGPQGPAGDAGEPGIAGPVGPAGPQGDAGPVGQQGPTGSPGNPGADGATGASGHDAALATTPVLPGTDCANGGIRVDAGIDADRSGSLDPDEVNPALTQFVCNGLAGPAGNPLPVVAFHGVTPSQSFDTLMPLRPWQAGFSEGGAVAEDIGVRVPVAGLYEVTYGATLRLSSAPLPSGSTPIVFTHLRRNHTVVVDQVEFPVLWQRAVNSVAGHVLVHRGRAVRTVFVELDAGDELTVSVERRAGPGGLGASGEMSFRLVR